MKPPQQNKITRKELEKWSKEELIQAVLLRNDDAKDYEKNLRILEKKILKSKIEGKK